MKKYKHTNRLGRYRYCIIYSMRYRHSNGFTLIELLVVISIISLLATISLASFSNTRMKARDARRLAEINQIHLAFQLSLDSSGGTYPLSPGPPFNDWVCLGHGSSGTCWDEGFNGSDTVDDAIQPFFSTIPDDPLNDTSCAGDAYAYWSDGNTTYLHWYYEDDSVPTDKACGRGFWGGFNAPCGKNYCYWAI